MKTKDIIGFLDSIAPFDLAEDWDNCGLQAGHPDWAVEKIMIGLDVSLPLMEAAQKNGVDLVLTHHPLMISPEKVIDFGQMPGRAIELCAKNRISIVSAHTNLDKAKEGLNDYFAGKIGLTDTTALVSDPGETADGAPATGIGRVGRIDQPMTLNQFGQLLKDKLNLEYIRVTGKKDLRINQIAICTGSGGSLIEAFLMSGADVYITGDVKYHEARRVEEEARAMIDVGHFGSEHMAVDLLYEKLCDNPAVQTSGVEVLKFKKEKDPFTIV